jgi:hypothetical protein
LILFHHFFSVAGGDSGFLKIFLSEKTVGFLRQKPWIPFMNFVWRSISVVSSDNVLYSYPLDDRSHHLTQFRRQKRRSMRGLTDALTKSQADQPAIPISVEVYLNHHPPATKDLAPIAVLRVPGAGTLPSMEGSLSIDSLIGHGERRTLT